ncbi:CIR protein PIR protein [Plasmodium vinckei]|uniref:CIR protein PIR protein n=1 Tax=Plasmodium vinckei TaxID=5860 RepID=A0A6V7SG09_PLAVN|nr:CIR protein PIR protein [Plasmodium vinckei]
MANPSYNIKDVYSVFNKIDGYFWVKNGGNVEYENQFISKYCPYHRALESGYCRNYLEKASSGVINLIDMLKDKFDSKYDNLAEYAILLLIYKLKQHPQYKSTNLNNFYTNHIEKNKHYDKKIKDNGPTYRDIIYKKKNLMDIKEISKFNEAFSILCKLYNGIINNKLDCTKYPNYPENFANKFVELNNDSNINGSTSYSKLLSTLSDDYNHLKNNYGNNSCNFPPLPKVKTPPSKLIPVLSTFSVIPVFLGIAYKYSLFGIDKIFQRQYLRKKLKKVKKKLKLNIRFEE